MNTWTDISNPRSHFFVKEGVAVESADASALRPALDDAFAFFTQNIVGGGNAEKFDLICVEVNCDTGRFILAATSEHLREDGRSDGCCVQIPKLQEFWYDADEEGLTDEEFSSLVNRKVAEIGDSFQELIQKSLPGLHSRSATRGFKYVVYGNDIGKPVFETEFNKTED